MGFRKIHPPRNSNSGSSTKAVFRAHLDDVENLSYGRGAKKQRGTGSRFTCHRLNQDERRAFDQAKRDGFLTVRGTGYRKNRKGSPVANTFRQRCDALAQICVVVEKRSGLDKVIIDVSTLRVRDDSALVYFLIETVFRSDHPDVYQALMVSKDERVEINNGGGSGGDSDSSVEVENMTIRPIHWESVKTNPIWGVNERLLVVNCDRDVAKSIAMGTLKASHSRQFLELQDDAEASTRRSLDQERNSTEPTEATGAFIPDEKSSTINNCPPVNDCNDEEDLNCIDWDDI